MGHKRPTTDTELLRSIDRRLRALEHPRAIQLGQWMISVSPVTGDLIADHIPSGNRHILAATRKDT